MDIVGDNQVERSIPEFYGSRVAEVEKCVNNLITS